MFWVTSHEEHERRFALKPMNCPGHMLLFGSALRSLPRPAVPLRRVRRRSTATSRPARCTGSCACSTSRRTTRTSSARAEQIEDEIFGCLDYAAYLYDLFGMEARFELSTRPENKLGTDEEWDFTEGALRSALERRGHRVRRERGRRRVLRPEDRPAHDRRRSAARGRWGRSSSTRRCRSASASRYMGADNAEHTPYVIHRALLGSLERFIGILIEHYAGAFPFWLAPVQVRVLPVGESPPRAGARARREARAVPRRGRRVRRDGRQADPQRRAREDPVRRRLRRQGIGRRARGPRARRRAVDQVARGASRDRLLR